MHKHTKKYVYTFLCTVHLWYTPTLTVQIYREHYAYLFLRTTVHVSASKYKVSMNDIHYTLNIISRNITVRHNFSLHSCTLVI